MGLVWLSWFPPIKIFCFGWMVGNVPYKWIKWGFLVFKEFFLHFFVKMSKNNLHCKNIFVPLHWKGYNTFPLG